MNQLVLKRIHNKIPVCSKCAHPKNWGFELDIVDSVRVGIFNGLKHVAVFWNTINYNVWLVYPVMSKAVVKREHLHQ